MYKLLGTVVVILVLLGVYYFTRSQFMPSSLNPASTPSSFSTPSSSGGASYIEYSPSALTAASTSRIVLFFYANWCPTCRPTDAEFKANSSQIPPGVTVIRVNYNDTETDQTEKDLAKDYGVTYQHTFVQIDSSGAALTKWNGGGIAQLRANLVPGSPPDEISAEPRITGYYEGVPIEP